MCRAIQALAVASAAALSSAAAAAPVAVISADTDYSAGVYTVHWRLSRPDARADVYVARTPDVALSMMRRVAIDDRAASTSATDPLGAGVRPYFYILPHGASRGTWTATRVVPLDGASNFRDLGGYAAADGRHVVWGKLFRSNGLSNLTEADYKTIDGLGVRIVCDLRTDQERQKQPTVWRGVQPAFYQSPKPVLDFDMKAAFGPGRPSAAHVHDYLVGAYRTMIDAYADEYRAMFRHLLAGDAPMIVHCSAGKDRTGIGSALILTALGVPRATALSDYALSGQLLYRRQATVAGDAKKPDPTAAMFAGLAPDVLQMLLASDPAYLEAALDQAAVEYGSVDGYLQNKLGVGPKERAALRARYLQ